MGLPAGMTVEAVLGSSFAVPGNAGMVYAKEMETGGLVFKEPEVRNVNLNIDGKIAGRLPSKAQMAALINNYNDSHKGWEETSGGLAYAGLGSWY